MLGLHRESDTTFYEVFEGTSSPLIEVAVAEPAVSSPRDGHEEKASPLEKSEYRARWDRGLGFLDKVLWF